MPQNPQRQAPLPAHGHKARNPAPIENRALAVSAVHSLAMVAAGGAIAWTVYRYLGLRFHKKSRLNLETPWALSLIAAGAIGVWSALT